MLEGVRSGDLERLESVLARMCGVEKAQVRCVEALTEHWLNSLMSSRATRNLRNDIQV